MSTYRSPRKHLEPVIIRHPRSWLLIAILTVCFTPFLAFPYVFARSTLRCSRAANECRIEVVRGLELWRTTRTFPQSSIEKAFVDDSPDADGDRLAGIALRVNHETVLIDGRSNVWIDEKREWANAVNAYLQDATRAQFEIEDGSTWPSYATTVVILLLLAAVIRTRTRFVIDYEHDTFRIEERIFRTSLEDVPLKDIVSVVIDEKDDGEGTILKGIALVFADGTRKMIHSHSNIDGKIKNRMVEQISHALNQRPN